MPRKATPLSDRDRIFVAEVLANGGHYAAAHRVAYPDWKGQESSRKDIARGLAPDDPNMLALDTFVNAAVANPGQADQVDKALALLRELQQRLPMSCSTRCCRSSRPKTSRWDRST